MSHRIPYKPFLHYSFNSAEKSLCVDSMHWEPVMRSYLFCSVQCPIRRRGFLTLRSLSVSCVLVSVLKQNPKKSLIYFLYINTLKYIVHTLQPFDAHFVCWRFYPMASFYKVHFIHSVVFPTIYVHRKYCPCMTFKFLALKRKSSISRISGGRIYFMWRIVIYSSQGLICPGTPFIVEVWEWISNFNPHSTGYVITFPCWD